MKEYAPELIRNVAFAGHSGAGKTSIIETILFNEKVIDRLGRVEEGNTVSDYDAEEIRRQCSINTTLIPIEHKGHKINILDLPGYRDFIGDIRNAMRVADSVVIVVDASSGVEVGAELAWEIAEEFNLPRVFVINKLDRERASFQRTLDQIRDTFGCRTILANYPVGEGIGFQGCVNLLKMKMSTGQAGKISYGEIPAEAADEVKRLRAELVEAAAEGDDELTSKFLDGAELTLEEILRGIEEDMLAHSIIPVIAASASAGPGCLGLLDFITECFPPPIHCPPFMAKTPSGEPIEIKPDKDGHPAAFVFKTISDPFAGHLTFFKVLSGVIANDMTLLNSTRGHDERISHLMTLRGKKQEPTAKLDAGDIGVLAKLNQTHTGDTLCDPKHPVVAEPTKLPPHTVLMAVKTKAKEDEEKIGVAIHRLVEQDPTLRLYRDPDIHQTILCGMGDTHLDVAVSRLRTQSKVDIDLEVPRVPYRETITRKAEGQGKHKKQSGGRGQYGDCWIRLEPLPEGTGFQFEWQIVGGVIPTKFQPSVEKGLVQAMARGIIAGCQAVDIKASCYDGSYHTVDSSDMAFQVAASKGFKAVARNAGPILLEPIYKVSATVPEQYMGDVLGDLNSRRGRILGVEAIGHKQVIQALVPLAEIFEYSKTLRSITQGRGTFEMAYDHFERVPAEIQAKVVAAATKHDDEDED